MAKRIGIWPFLWSAAPTDVESAETFLDTLEGVDPEAVLQALTDLNASINNGDLAGDPDELAALQEAIGQMMRRVEPLATAARLARERVPTINLGEPRSIDPTAEIDRIIEVAFDKIRLWEEGWHARVEKLFQFKGTLGFGEGGKWLIDPPKGINHLRITLAANQLRQYVYAQKHMGLKQLGIGYVPPFGYAGIDIPKTDEEQTAVVRTWENTMVAEFERRLTVATSTLESWTTDFSKWFGMANIINFTQQYVVGKVFGLIAKVVKAVWWVLIGETSLHFQEDFNRYLEKVRYLQKWTADKPGREWAHRAYTQTLERLERLTPSQILRYGMPETGTLRMPAHRLAELAPIAPPPPSELVSMIDEVGRNIAALPWAGIGTAMGSLLSQIEAQINADVDSIIAEAFPAGYGAFNNELAERIRAGEDLNPTAELDEWIDLHEERISTAIENRARNALNKLLEERGFDIPTTPDEVFNTSYQTWVKRILSYYDGASSAEAYSTVMMFLNKLKEERGGASTDEQRAWVDGLIANVEAYAEQLSQALVVKLPEEYFTIPMELKLK